VKARQRAVKRETDLREKEAYQRQADEHAQKMGKELAEAVRKVQEHLKLYSTRPLDGCEGEQRELDLQVLRERVRQLEGRVHEAKENAWAANARRLEAILDAQEGWRVAETYEELARQAECRSRVEVRSLYSINTLLKTPSAPSRASGLSRNRQGGNGGKRRARGQGGKGGKRRKVQRPVTSPSRLAGPWVAEL
jgi:hypothetical protein